MPAPSPPVYAHASNEHSRRGAFATKQLWVTPYSDDEKWPAGEYPLMAGDNNNIVTWTGMVRGLLPFQTSWPDKSETLMPAGGAGRPAICMPALSVGHPGLALAVYCEVHMR